MLFTALFLTLLPCAPRSGSSLDELGAVRAVLQRTEGATAARDEVLVRRLVALGADVAPVLFGLATGEGLETLLGEDELASWMCAPEQMGAIALDALADLPHAPVRDFLRAHCAARPSREARSTALRILGQQGSSDGLALALELCRASGDELEHRSLRQPAVEALGRILRTDLQAVRELEGPLLAADPGLQRVACEALAECGRAEAASVLARLIGRDPELDLAAIEGLARLGERLPWALADSIAPRLRKVLGSSQPALRAAAAHALGRMQDAFGVPALIASRNDPDAQVARAAQWSLRVITGEGRLETHAQWASWLEGELAWWQEQGPARLAALDPHEPSGMAGALRELLAHPLGRERVCEQLTGSLAAFEPAAQVLACETLARLEARRAVPALVELLFEAAPEVRQAAWQALRALTGRDLPAEPRLWEEFAFG